MQQILAKFKSSRSCYVTKTGSAPVVSGGIGASVDVKTAKPLDVGDKFSGQFKAITDQSSGDATPAFSGMFSKNFDDTFGLLTSISYQQRKFERDSTEVRRWRADSPITSVDGNGDETTLNFHPTQHAVLHTESDRERVNANILLQYAPNESMTALATSRIRARRR